MKLPLTLTIASALALTACSRDAPAPDVEQSAAPNAAPSTSTAPEAVPSASENVSPKGVTEFPAAMHGRWGLVPADCTSQRGDNKGLITVDEKSIRFYESVASIAAVKQATVTSLSATLAYDGEGMQWQHDAKLELKPQTGELVMEEFGPDAVPGARTYTRCK